MQNVNELDFELIKKNLITFLKGQTEFQDYNFLGSGMNVIIDMLAYITHYMGLYNNLSYNEMFLDSGLLRSSIVSKATELGYMPRQMTASTAKVNMSIDLSGEGSIPPFIDVPMGTEFSAINSDNKSLKFVTKENYTLNNNGSDVFSNDLVLIEGKFVTEEWTYDSSALNKVFTLENSNIDTTYFTVNMKNFEGSTTTIAWLKYTSIINIDNTTKAFFFREREHTIEVYFGNGILGREPDDGNLAIIEYFVTSGSIANNIQKFSLINGVGGYSRNNFVVTTVYGSRSGDEKESLAHIKHNAPLFYQSQNRAVTEIDYNTIILKNFGGIEAINVWGGEKNIPPMYGRVVISIKPSGADVLIPSVKDEILEVIEQHTITGIIPVMVDPEYIEVDLAVYAKYVGNKTIKSNSELLVDISDTIDDYFVENLYLFDSTLKYSELLTNIDDTDVSMHSNYVDLKLSKKFIPINDTAYTYMISFYNPIKEGSVSMLWTNASGSSMEIKDHSDGILYQYSDNILATGTYGTVDYATGEIVLAEFNPNISESEIFKLYMIPSEYNIDTVFNNILLKGTVTISLEKII